MASSPPSSAIPLSEIDEQREKGWPDFHPEEYSDRFNMAMGPPVEHPFQGIICPGCFVVLHEEATGLTCTWKLTPGSNFKAKADLDG